MTTIASGGRRFGRILAALLLGGCVATGAPAQEAGLRVVALRCEGRVDPLGLDTPVPRLSWVLAADRRGEVQAAWQVLAALAPELLAEGTADVWDSGIVPSGQSIQVPYAGRRLRSSERVFWKVRVWDRADRPSPWSPTATWTMGLMAPADWKARWIRFGWSEDLEIALDGASWIWTDEGPEFPQAATLAPPGERWFARSFEMPGTRVERALLAIAADNTYELFVNGQRAGASSEWRTADVYDVTRQLTPGAVNTLMVHASNGTDRPTPAGVIARLLVTGADQQTLEVVTNGSWRAFRGADRDAPPAEVQVAARFGDRPWGRIRAVSHDLGGLPIVRREFDVGAPISRALLHVSGLGHGVVFINGRRVGNRLLDPGWTVYERTVPYTTFEVTDFLQTGENALGVMIGKGFYNTVGNRRIHGADANRPLALRLQLEIETADGARQIVGSQGSWQWTHGPVVHDAIQGGMDYDARRLPRGWDRPGFDDRGWMGAIEWEGPEGVLTAQVAPPLVDHDVFLPVAVDEPQPGTWVYTYAQNCSARPRLRVRGESGAVVRLVPAEQRSGHQPRRNDGNGLVDQAGIGTPQYLEYTLRGGAEESWTPEFFYTGFQYLQVEGAVPAGQPNPQGLPEVIELASVHVRSAAETIGGFECSNELFNRIDRLVDWSVRSNLSHVLTDCPHREKLGWLEVSYLMGPSIAFRYDLSGLYAKVARDIRDSQLTDGNIPTVAPDYPGNLFRDGFRLTPEWGAAGVFVPELLHTWYGDDRTLAESYPSMRRFALALRAAAGEDGLLPATGLGDWYDYGHGQPLGPSQFTPTDLSASATYALCLKVLEDAAVVLGREAAEVEEWQEARRALRERFRKTWFDPARATFTNRGSPQTANALALAAGMVDPDEVPKVVEAIVADLRARGNQQTSGDIGHVYLLRALAAHDRSDVLADILNRTTLGSYGHIIESGWTSLPEAWDADTGASMLHCMLGHVLEWFQGSVGGIGPLLSDLPSRGRVFQVGPHLVPGLTWARAWHRSPSGEIACAWRRQGDTLEVDVTVPVNAAALVTLPARGAEDVREGNQELGGASPDVWYVSASPGEVRLFVGSGTYHFRSLLALPQSGQGR